MLKELMNQEAEVKRRDQKQKNCLFIIACPQGSSQMVVQNLQTSTV